MIHTHPKLGIYLENQIAKRSPHVSTPYSVQAWWGTPLVIHTHPKLGIYLENQIEPVVKSYEEAMELLKFGMKMRSVAATNMNSLSSREGGRRRDRPLRTCLRRVFPMPMSHNAELTTLIWPAGLH